MTLADLLTIGEPRLAVHTLCHRRQGAANARIMRKNRAAVRYWILAGGVDKVS